MSGYVYFLLSGNGLVKIGITTDPLSRILTLANMNSERITLLGLQKASRFELGKTEKSLHSRFSQFRHHGEWFEGDAKILEYAGKHNKTLVIKLNSYLENYYNGNNDINLKRDLEALSIRKPRKPKERYPEPIKRQAIIKKQEEPTILGTANETSSYISFDQTNQETENKRHGEDSMQEYMERARRFNAKK